MLDLTRRQFLAAVTLLVAHDELGASMTNASDKHEPRILSLELLTAAPLADMKRFYHQTLGLRVLEEKADRLTIAGGETRITFISAGPNDGKPFYHFAFNIPENKIVSGRDWQKQRGPLLPIPAHQRATVLGDDIVDYSHWNAHSVFFFDPAENVVEYIARHDLKNAASGPFDTKDILYVSEIGWVVDDVDAVATTIREAARLEQYRVGNSEFRALGDERGLLLVFKRGRHLSFDASPKKSADVFRTKARIKGGSSTKLAVPSYPYEIEIES